MSDRPPGCLQPQRTLSRSPIALPDGFFRIECIVDTLIGGHRCRKVAAISNWLPFEGDVARPGLHLVAEAFDQLHDVSSEAAPH